MLDFFIGWGVGEGFYMFYIFSNHTFIKCILGKSIKSVINIIFSPVIWVTIIMKYIVYYLFLILIFINSFNLASSNYFGLLFRFYFLLILFLFCGELVKKTGILRLTAEPLSLPPPPPISQYVLAWAPFPPPSVLYVSPQRVQEAKTMVETMVFKILQPRHWNYANEELLMSYELLLRELMSSWERRH